VQINVFLTEELAGGEWPSSFTPLLLYHAGIHGVGAGGPKGRFGLHGEAKIIALNGNGIPKPR
jgi:hypothetical protein